MEGLAYNHSNVMLIISNSTATNYLVMLCAIYHIEKQLLLDL